MPVREFTGELDKPTVREFTGKLDPPNIRQPFAPKNAFTVRGEIFDQDKQVSMAGALPYIGAAGASLLVPGSGLVALGGQALAAGGGGAAGELLRQQFQGEPASVSGALKEGAGQAIGTAVGGGVLKGLGALAKKIFSSPLPNLASSAAEFAKLEKAPFPLSFAAPGTPAAKVQDAASSFAFFGKLRTMKDAKNVALYLNNTVGRMTEKAAVFDEAARKGQSFLREVFEPGETAIKNTFAKYTEAVGAEAQIPTTNLMAAVKVAANQLKNRGQTSGGLSQRLNTIVKRAPASFTPKEFDELYGAIFPQAFTSKAHAGGEGRIVLEAIAKDLDTFGKSTGISFADEIAKSNLVREQYRELTKIPQLERLAAEMKTGSRNTSAKGTNDWMDSLFDSGNGKALGKIRELNPELYHDLADAWLARHIDGFSRTTNGMIGRTLDGQQLRVWFEQNQKSLKMIFGAPQVEALDNFSLYARFMAGAAQSADRASISPRDLLMLGPSAAGTGAAAMFGSAFLPAIIVPTESAGFFLARALSDPSSKVFKAFTTGIPQATREVWLRGGQIAGQATAVQIYK